MTINLDEIEKALGEATQGKWIDPWGTEIDEDFEGIKSETGEVVLSVQWHDGDRLYLCKPNAHLIAYAPEWLRLLVERVRKLEKVAEAADCEASLHNVGCDCPMCRALDGLKAKEST